MFKWSWKFHNSVNSRIGKPVLDWDTTYNLYSDPGVMVCTKSCDQENDVTLKPSISMVRAMHPELYVKGYTIKPTDF